MPRLRSSRGRIHKRFGPFSDDSPALARRDLSVRRAVPRLGTKTAPAQRNQDAANERRFAHQNQ